MSQRFIKYFPSDEASWLLTHYPNAFIVLTKIACRARRQNGHADGLIIGDAIIGASDMEPGMSRQNFRTALEKLVEFNYIKIISNGKKFFEREKSTIKVTIKSTLVNLCNSTIYDINPDDGNHCTNQQLTNSQPTANHKQERIRRIKKDKEIPTPTPSVPAKIKFREFVQLTQAEYDSLLAKNGQAMLDLMLDCLDSYKGSSGKAYESDFHTMKQGGWVVNRVKKDMHERNVKTAPRQHGSDIQPSATQFVPRSVLRGSNTGSLAQGGVNA